MDLKPVLQPDGKVEIEQEVETLVPQVSVKKVIIVPQENTNALNKANGELYLAGQKLAYAQDIYDKKLDEVEKLMEIKQAVDSVVKVEIQAEEINP